MALVASCTVRTCKEITIEESKLRLGPQWKQSAFLNWSRHRRRNIRDFESDQPVRIQHWNQSPCPGPGAWLDQRTLSKPVHWLEGQAAADFQHKRDGLWESTIHGAQKTTVQIGSYLRVGALCYKCCTIWAKFWRFIPVAMKVESRDLLD